MGARNLRQAELLAFHHAGLVGAPASDSALWRMPGEIDERAEVRIAKAGARVRERVWGASRAGPLSSASAERQLVKST